MVVLQSHVLHRSLVAIFKLAVQGDVLINGECFPLAWPVMSCSSASARPECRVSHVIA